MEEKAKALCEKIKEELEKIGLFGSANPKNDLKSVIEELSNHLEEMELRNHELSASLAALKKINNSNFKLFSDSPIAYLIINSLNEIKDINPTACFLLGAVKEHINGIKFTQLIQPDYQDTYYLYLKRLEKETGPQSCEIKLLSQTDNSALPVRIHGVHHFQTEGEEPAYLLALTKVAQQMETEEKLAKESQKVKDSERLLSEMGKIAKIGGWELDCTTMQQVWTDETYTIHDREKGVYNPNSTEELSRFEPGSKEIIENAFEAAFNKGEPYDLELEMTTIKGNRKWVRAVCSPILKEGKISKLNGTLQDITERKLADKEKHEIDILFQTLIEKSSEAITIVNENGYAVYVSPTTIAMLGYSAAELCKLRFSEILHPDDIESIEAVFIEVMQAPGKEVKLFGRLKRKSGEYIWSEGVATNWFHDPVINGIVVNFRDVSKREKSEETIRISLAKYKTLFENFPMGITVSDRNGNIIETNTTAERLLGISAKEQAQRQLNGAEWQIVRTNGTLMPTEEYASVRALKEGQKVDNVEMGIVKSDKSITWLNVTAAPIPMEEYGVVVTYNDITERKLVEEKVLEAQENYKNIFENNPLPMWVYDLETFYFLEVNEAAIIKYGYSRDEFLKMTILDIRPKEDHIRLIENIASITQGIDEAGYWKHIKKNGSIIDVEITSHTLKYSDRRAELVLANDVTERKQSQEKLHENQVLLKQVLDSEPDAIFAIDLNYNLLINNKHHQKVLIETGGKHLNAGDSIFPDEYQPGVLDFWRGLYNRTFSGEEFKYEMEWPYSDGQLHTIECNFSPLRSSSDIIIGALVVIHDITERKHAEKQLAKLAERLNLATQSAEIGIWDWDIQNNKLIWDDQMIALYGLQPGEFKGAYEAWLNGLHPDDRELSNSISESAVRGEREYNTEFRVLWPDGSVHWLKADGRVYRNDKGTAVRMIGVNYDITDRKLSEQKLRESEERYRKLAENFPDTTISFFNRDLVVTFVTGQELFNTGKTASDFIGKRFDELLIPSLIPLANKSYNDAFNGHINSFEAKSFNDQYIRVIALPLVESDGTINEIQVISQNITEQKKSEEKLRKSLEREQFLGNLIRNASIAVGVGYPDGRLGMCNLAFQKLTGYSEEELQNIAWNTVLTPTEWLDKEIIILSELDRTKQPVTYEKEYLHKSGKRIPIELFVHPFFDPSGNVSHYYAFITDITERKKAEENIRKSEHILRLFVEHSPAAIAMFDSEMRYIVHSKRYLTDYRLPEQDLTGRSHYEVFPEMDETRKEIHRRCLSGEIIKCEEDPLPRIDGKLDFVRYELRPWYEDGTSIGGLIFFSEVITERKMALTALAENERRLRKTLETTSDGFWIVDFNRNFIEVNEAYCKMSGYTRKELLNMRISDLEALETTADTDERIRKISRTAGDRFETVHRRKDGSLFDVEVSVNMLDQEQGLMICFCRDITDRKKAEQQLRESEIRFSTIFLDSPVAIAISRLKDSKVIHVNRAIINLLGYLPEEILGKTTTQLGIWGNLNDRERFVKILSKDQRIEGLETILIKKTGERRQVLLWGELIQLNGEPCMMAEIIDISERKKAEQQLRERETELNNAQELAQMASWRVDLTNNQLSLSKNYKKLIRLEDETIDVTLDYFISRVHPDDVHLMNPENYQLTPESLPVSSDFRISMPDGSVKWFQNSMVGEFAEGRLVALKGTSIDITEKKKREDEIRSQNEKLSAILNSLPDKLFVHDANGNFLEAYTTNSDGYIVPIDQLLGSNLHDIFPKEVADLNLKYLKECLSRKKLITHEFSTDYKGTWATFEVRVFPFMEDKVIRFVRDITKSKEYERQIVKLNKAIEQSPVAIVITDTDANITYTSRAFEQITGYSKDEVIGKNTRILKSGGNSIDVYTNMWNTIKSGEIWEGELINKKKDGTLYWEYLSITPLFENSSKITSYLAVKQDITDKKNREQEILDLNASLERKVVERTAQLEAANKAKSEFLANMSHEIRTPMNAILGYTELLGPLVNSKLQQEYLQSIKSSGKGLLTLINDILDLSKIEAGKLEIFYDYVSTESFFTEFEKIFALKVQEKKLDFNLEITSGTPECLYIDESRLRQIIFNLVGNAIKFTTQGSVNIKVYTENPQEVKLKDKTEYYIDLYIEISDTGSGISKDQLEEIFKPFVQEADKRAIGGTGLGLSISRRLAELMNGKIEVESELGKGSKFLVKLPDVHYLLNCYTTQASIDLDITRITFEKATILIIDDIEHNRKYLIDALRNTNFVIHQTTNGEEGVKMAREFLPDLIITDIRMPGLNGFEVLNILREDALTKHIPVIAYSASVMKEQKLKIINSEFAGLLIKPVQLIELYFELMKTLPYKISDPVPIETEGSALALINNMEELIFELENNYSNSIEKFKVRQPMNEVKEFGEEMIKLGTRHNAANIIKYGSDLVESVSNFNINVIVKLINNYPSIIEELRASNH